METLCEAIFSVMGVGSMSNISFNGIYFEQSDKFVWGLGGVYKQSIDLSFSGSMMIDAPNSLAVAAVSLLDVSMNVEGNILSSAKAGAIVELPVPVPDGTPPLSGPIDELIAAGSITGNAEIRFSGIVKSKIIGGGAIGAFSGQSSARVEANGIITSENGFAIRTQAGFETATTLTSGYVFAGTGECAVMNEGGLRGLVINKGQIETTGEGTAGILATSRIDFTFSGNRQAALAGSSAEVENHGTIFATGDGIRTEVQGDAVINNTGKIISGASGIRVIDMDGADKAGCAQIESSGAILSDDTAISVDGDFASSLITVSGTVSSSSGTAISTQNSDDTITLQAGAQIFGAIETGAGNDRIIVQDDVALLGQINTGIGDDAVFMGSQGGRVDAGAGNDTLWAGNGCDVFIFSGSQIGNDRIHGFDPLVDQIVLDTEPVSITAVDDDVILTLASGTITLIDVGFLHDDALIV